MTDAQNTANAEGGTEAGEVAKAEEVTDTRDYETEARNMGWHDPQDDDFKGDRENALDAKGFVEKGENELPVLKANLRKLQAKSKQDTADMEEFKTFMQNQNKTAKEEFDRKLREAVEDGDTKRYDELKKSEPVAAEVKPKNPIYEEMVSRHEWYDVDEKKTQLAMAADQSVSALRGILSPSEYVDRVEQEMERLMPTPKRQTNTVNGGRKNPKVTGAKTFANMPNDIQNTCNRMVKKWNITQDDYVKNYYNELEK